MAALGGFATVRFGAGPPRYRSFGSKPHLADSRLPDRASDLSPDCAPITFHLANPSIVWLPFSFLSASYSQETRCSTKLANARAFAVTCRPVGYSAHNSTFGKRPVVENGYSL
jgi:hypothetical protein